MSKDKSDKLKKLHKEALKVKSEISLGVEVLTVDGARDNLKRNIKTHIYQNRKVSQRTIRSFAKDILAGRWKIATPIVFDKNNYLLDGQTRCYAVIEANEPIITLVLRGVDPETFDVFDGGKPRTFKDVATAIVHTNANGDKVTLTKPAVVSAAINYQYSMEKYKTNIDKNRGLLTNPEMARLIMDNFEYYDEPFLFIGNTKNYKIKQWRDKLNNGVTESIIAAFYYKHKLQNNGQVNEFLDFITSNKNIPPIVLEFQQLLSESKRRRSDEKGYLSPTTKFKLFDTLFSYYKTGSINKRKHFPKLDTL